MKAAWISWEKQRRSLELAHALDVEIIIHDCECFWLVRYIKLTLLTLHTLVVRRPDILFCQNPSIILNFILIFFRPLFKYKLIADRHSNFKFENKNSPKIKWKIFFLVSRFTAKKTDLTIVTNNYLKDKIENWGGRSFVLQDKIPKITNLYEKKMGGDVNIFVVNTYSDDEPYYSVIEAGRLINKSWYIYISGKIKIKLHKLCPKNVILTDYIDESDYFSYMQSCDIIVVLTKKEYLLNCGSYEALALNKPMILSNTTTIRSYFSKGVVYVDNSPEQIASAINTIVDNYAYYCDAVSSLKEKLAIDWSKRFTNLKTEISSLHDESAPY
ncbi:glycosyltransferase [Desulfovermiculus halophilus]|uniref:glycosyltransferase n=1 Tax=Desulfovermiculus halophilus TaxID=339722 RepID=UPI0013779A00|nr:glycosyltransferase [Desulfovermiculus halophilus]